MAERQYNKEQVAAIFERASQVERAALPAPTEGLTLTELHEIGREVGISPESISLAAHSLDQPTAPADRKIFGVPIGVARTVELDRKISDSDWETLVADLRTTFDARGKLRIDGPFRQWTNGNLSALLEPTPTGHRLRLQSMKQDARSLIIMGTVFTVAAAVSAISFLLFAHSAAPSGITTMVGTGLAMLGFGAWRGSSWARVRAAQFEEIIARVTRSRGKPVADRAAARIPDLT